jgi:hypothetical protein
LQQHYADQREYKHQVDDDDDVLHQSKIRPNRTNPGFPPGGAIRLYRNSPASLHDHPALFHPGAC